MNKKVIIITVSIIAALAILAGSSIAIFSSLFSESSHEHDGQSSVASGENSVVDNSASNVGTNSDSGSSNNNAQTPSDNQNNSTTSIPKANKDMTTFIADNVTAKIGDKVTVPIYVSNNKGFMGLMAKFEYDTSVLKYTGFKKGDVLTDYEVPTKDGVIGLQSVENGDVKKDGVIIYLQFDVIAKNPTTTQIDVVIGDHDVGNYSMQYVKTDTIDGSVTIK